MAPDAPGTALPGDGRRPPLTAQFPVRRPWNAGAATGIGSLPGTDPNDAAAMVAGELPALPHVVELPDRGVGADITGRAVGMLVDLYAEVVPSGWRISRRPGRDNQRAIDFLSWDVDAAERHYAGAEWVKVQICGPWTLAAMLELSNGHRALTDPGAVDDLATSLAEGLVGHLRDIAARIPGAGVLVQVDEPALPAVLAGNLSTASGFGTVRAVAPVRAIEVLSQLTGAVAGRPTVAHCCDTAAPLRLLRAAGFDALSVDMTTLSTQASVLDPVGEAIESGAVLLAGVVPAAGSDRSEPLQTWAAPVLRVWDRLGFPRSQLPSAVVPTPSCGLVAADRDGARSAMKICRELADAFQDPPENWS